MPVSIKDIAKKAGVTPSTVSRALKNHPSIGAETTQRIHELAKELGYIPSAVARSLVSSRSNTIGVAVNDFLNPFYVNLISNIEEAVQDNPYHIFVSSFHRNKERELALTEVFFESRLAGVIVLGSLIDRGYLAWPNRAAMPIVLVSAPAYPFSVSVNHYLGVCQAVEHLIGLGHRQIAFVAQGHHSHTEKQRLQGYRATLTQHHLPVDDRLIVAGDGGMTGGIAAVPRLLALPHRPTAIICYNDMTAVGVINGLQQQGYRVPQDFSVVGFDDLSIASAYSPSLTTVRQPAQQIGQGAIDILRRLIQGETDTAVRIFEPEFIVRQSTGPVLH
jgi:DNA-binding LacI/PurR family transcriptional regulator